VKYVIKVSDRDRLHILMSVLWSKSDRDRSAQTTGST